MTPDPDATPPRPRRRRRSWPQRLVLSFNLVLVFACVVASLAIFVAQKNLDKVQLVQIKPAKDQIRSTPAIVVESVINGTVATSVVSAPETTVPDSVQVSVPPGTVKAANYLITGSDSRDCIDPKSPYAGAFLNGSVGGARPDTIMLLRIEPDSGKAAILSFPRDMWVPLAGTGRMSKINGAFDKSDPTRLIATIESYFQVPVDHYVSIDFCLFKDLVNAVGGVAVPFLTPVRDKNTGLDIIQVGCTAFNGESALAYVRSRHIEWRDSQGVWHNEGTSDIGRIRRQQDFVRRVMQRVRSKGVLDLGFVKNLLDTFQKRVVVDQNLTADDVLRLANAMKSFDPVATRSFIIEGTFGYKATQAVIVPNLTSTRMLKILSIFRGQGRIGDAPTEQQNPITTDPGATTTPATTVPGGTVQVADNANSAYGAGQAVVPDRTATC